MDNNEPKEKKTNMNTNEELNKKFEELKRLNQEKEEYNKGIDLKIHLLKEKIIKDNIKLDSNKDKDNRVGSFISYIEKEFNRYNNDVSETLMLLSSIENEKFYFERMEALDNAPTCCINNVEYKIITSLVDFCFWFKRIFYFCGYCYITDDKEKHYDIDEKFDNDGCPLYENTDNLKLFFEENIKNNVDKMYLDKDSNVFIMVLKNKKKFVFHTEPLRCKVKDILLPKDSWFKRIVEIFNKNTVKN